MMAQASRQGKQEQGRGKGKWSWELRTEGWANHYGDTLFGVYAIADMKNCRTLPAREVLAARRRMEGHSSGSNVSRVRRSRSITTRPPPA